MVPYLDRTNLVNATVRTVGKTLLEGMILVDPRPAAFPRQPTCCADCGVTIPVSLLIAFICMHHFKIPPNLLSLGAIDFGIIVDGAIVVMENILRKREEDEGRAMTTAMSLRRTEGGPPDLFRHACHHYRLSAALCLAAYRI